MTKSNSKKIVCRIFYRNWRTEEGNCFSIWWNFSNILSIYKVLSSMIMACIYFNDSLNNRIFLTFAVLFKLTMSRFPPPWSWFSALSYASKQTIKSLKTGSNIDWSWLIISFNLNRISTIYLVVDTEDFMKFFWPLFGIDSSNLGIPIIMLLLHRFLVNVAKILSSYILKSN